MASVSETEMSYTPPPEIKAAVHSASMPSLASKKIEIHEKTKNK